MPLSQDFYYTVDEVREILAENHRQMRQDFPETSEKAADLIQKYLRLFDPSRLRVFQGQVQASVEIVDQLTFALFSISGLLELQDQGHSNVTPLQKDIWCRRYLKLPYRCLSGDAVS